MKPTKLLYLALALMFITAGCKKKEPQPSQQSPSHDVTKSAKPAKSLQQADGDIELSEIYKKYNQAIRKWDAKEIKKYVSGEAGKKFDQIPEDLERLSETEREFALEMIEYMKSDAAKDYEVIRQKIESDKGTAILYLRRKDDAFPYGLVSFVKENGIWKIEKESWSNKAKNWDIKPPQDLRPIDVAAVDISFVQEADGSVKIEVIAKNNGEQNISELSYTFTINECEEKGKGMPTYNFGPGKESTFDFSYAYDNYYRVYLKNRTIQKPFELKMVLVLDPEDELKESNEENNKITKTFYLKDYEPGATGGRAKDDLSRIPPKVQDVRGVVRGIVYDPDNPAKSCALIGSEGRIVHIGDTVNGATVIKINKKSVEFEKEGEKYTQTVQP